MGGIGRNIAVTQSKVLVPWTSVIGLTRELVSEGIVRPCPPGAESEPWKWGDAVDLPVFTALGVLTHGYARDLTIRGP